MKFKIKWTAQRDMALIKCRDHLRMRWGEIGEMFEISGQSCINRYARIKGTRPPPAARRKHGDPPPVPPKPLQKSYSSISAIVFGDPPIGQSALDQRK